MLFGQVITAMESAEREVVEFVREIIPADAKGLVERWLLQVEHTMKDSLREAMAMSVEAYKTNAREDWVVEWPGQVVIAASTVHWTAEVTNVRGESTISYSFK